MALDILFGERGHAGGNFAIDRDVDHPALRRGRDQGPRFARVALEKAFPLEHSQVLHDRGLTRETEVLLNLARARRQPFGALFRLDELQDIFLPGSEHMNMFAKTCASATAL